MGYKSQKVNTWGRSDDAGSQAGENKGQESESTKAVNENAIGAYGNKKTLTVMLGLWLSKTNPANAACPMCPQCYSR